MFIKAGRVVGICTNADPKEGRGVYAGLKPIHQLLASAGLQDLVPEAQQPKRDSFAQATPDDTASRQTPEEAGPSKLERELAQMSQARARRDPGPRNQVASASDSAEESISAEDLESAEVVCIIRPRNQPSRVVIINRASRKFLAYLNGEKDRLVPTMGQIPRENSTPADHLSAENSNGFSRAELTPEKEASPQITAVWKPALSTH